MTRRDAIARMRALATKAEHRYWRMLIDGKPWTVLTDGVGFIAVQANDMSAGVPTTKAKRWIESALRLTGRSSKRVTRATFDHWFVRRPRQLECGHLVGLVGGTSSIAIGYASGLNSCPANRSTRGCASTAWVTRSWFAVPARWSASWVYWARARGQN